MSLLGNLSIQDRAQTHQMHHLMRQDVNEKGIQVGLEVLSICRLKNTFVVELDPEKLVLPFPNRAVGPAFPVETQNFSQRSLWNRPPTGISSRKEVKLQLLPSEGRDAVVICGSFLGVVERLRYQISLAC